MLRLHPTISTVAAAGYAEKTIHWRAFGAFQTPRDPYLFRFTGDDLGTFRHADCLTRDSELHRNVPPRGEHASLQPAD